MNILIDHKYCIKIFEQEIFEIFLAGQAVLAMHGQLIVLGKLYSMYLLSWILMDVIF